MKKFRLTSVFLSGLFTLFFISSFNIKGQDANTILKKVDEVLYSPKDQKSQTKIINIDKAGRSKIQKAIVLQKGTNKRLFRFTEPASQKGIAFLSLPDDVMYMYMPAYGKERRIASHIKNQSFGGMTFTYEDLESVLLSEKYNPRILQQDNDYYILELTIKEGIKSEYSKAIMKVNKKEFYPVYVEYYDKNNKKIKTSEYKFEKRGKYWSPIEIKMTDLRTNQSTQMILETVEYDVGLSDDEFTVRKLIQ